MTFRTGTWASLLRSFACAGTLGLLVVGASGCNDDSSTAGPSPQPTTARPEGKSGTISVESGSPIVGQQGKLLVVFAKSRDGANPIARACARITSDRFEFPAMVMTDIGTSQDPCGSTAPTVFPKGGYTLLAGIYDAPYSHPEKESSLTVEVRGDAPATVKVNGASISR